MEKTDEKVKEYSFRLRDWVMLLSLATFWGGSFYCNAVALEEMSPLEVVLARVSIAALTLLIYHRAKRMAWPTDRAFWRNVVLLGITNNVLPYTLIVIGQTGIGSALASIMNATTPIFTVVIAHFCTQDEKLTPIKSFGIMIGFVGVAVMMIEAVLATSDILPESGISPLVARLAALSAAFSYGIAVVIGKQLRGAPILSVATGHLGVSSVLLLVAAIASHQAPELLSLSGEAIFAVIFLAVPSTAIAYLLFFTLLKSVGAGNLSMVTFIVPAFAIVLGVFVRGEALSIIQIIGMFLILLAFTVIDRGLRQKIFRRR